jgi:hypothetical protein
MYKGKNMEETKKLNWKPEDNNYLNEVFDKLNLILAFVIILAPIITSLLCLVGLEMDFKNCLLIVYIVFVIMKIISISVNFRFFKFRKLVLLEILSIALLLMLCISEIVNSPIDAQFIFILGYFFVYLIFSKLDKENIFIVTSTAPSLRKIKNQIIVQHFGIPEERIIHTLCSAAKLEILKNLHSRTKKDILFIEDNFKILLSAEEMLSFVKGYHISSLLA